MVFLVCSAFKCGCSGQPFVVIVSDADSTEQWLLENKIALQCVPLRALRYSHKTSSASTGGVANRVN